MDIVAYQEWPLSCARRLQSLSLSASCRFSVETIATKIGRSTIDHCSLREAPAVSIIKDGGDDDDVVDDDDDDNNDDHDPEYKKKQNNNENRKNNSSSLNESDNDNDTIL